MLSQNLGKNRIPKISSASRFLLVFVLMFAWIFSGWPQIFNFSPETHETQAAVNFVRVAGVSGTSFTLDIGTTGTDRLVVIIVGDERTSNPAESVIIDGKELSECLRTL